jgi:hypothetical protein
MRTNVGIGVSRSGYFSDFRAREARLDLATRVIYPERDDFASISVHKRPFDPEYSYFILIGMNGVGSKREAR